MNFIDVCFKSNAVGTVNTYNCETNLYGISDTYEEKLIVTFEYNNNGLYSCKYNSQVTLGELYSINDILINKYHDTSFLRVKVNNNYEKRKN